MLARFLGAKNESRPSELSRRFIWAAAVIAACLFPTLAFGQTNSGWNGGTGNWSNATDWNPNGAPNNGGGNTYNVTIDSGGTDTVTLDQNATISSLVLGAITGTERSVLQNASSTAETLSITGGLTVNYLGEINLNSGSALTIGGSTTFYGALYLTQGSSVAVSGNFTNLGNETIDLEQGSSLTVSGNLSNSNSSTLTTNQNDTSGKSNTLTVTGILTNAGVLALGQNDVANIGTLVTSGSDYLAISTGATLNLTNQPNGITDVQNGSELVVAGTVNAGSRNGLANLNSVEGDLELQNGQTTAVTPGSGTLTVSNRARLDMYQGSTLTVLGNLSNSGIVNTFASGSAASNSLTVTGTFTNNVGATTYIGKYNNTSDVANVGTLLNNGTLTIGTGATLNLTNQPNGITDVFQGSTIDLFGALLSGSNSGLANLTSIEGTLILENGSALTLASSSLAIGKTGVLNLQAGSSLALTNLTNSASVTAGLYSQAGTGNLTVTGTLTNNSGAGFSASSFSVVNVGTLVNNGVVSVGDGATLNLTNSGTLANSGTILISAIGNFAGGLVIEVSSLTLSGKGAVSLAGGNISGSAASDVFTNKSTIEGSGNIGNGKIGVVNAGSILANETEAGAPSTLYIDTTGTGFSNSSGATNGILNVSAKNTVIIEGGPFTNFSSGTLTGGTYIVAGTLEFAAGTGVVTNDANITVSGKGEIFNTSNNTNALNAFADNGTKGVFTVYSSAFIDANEFTNSGTLTVGSGTFDASTGLTNFDSTTGTLTGGIYNVTGTLKFSSANIVTNAANITLTGTTSAIEDQNGNNALVNFATNASAGSFTLAGKRNFATSGSFSNAGRLVISKGSTFTVGGTNSFTQTAGTITVSGGLASAGGVNVSGGSVFGIGTITGNINLTGGLLSPGAVSKKAGELTVSGTYTQSGSGALDVDLGGATAGTQYDVLNITSTASLGGMLNVDLISGFKPIVGESFDIMNYTSETGTFTTTNLPKVTGDHWTVTYNATDVVLTLVAGPAAASAVSASPATRVSRNMGASATSTREPAAILSRVSCLVTRLLGLTSCGTELIASGASRGQRQLASVSAGSGMVHNNVMVATHSMSVARVSGSHESSASAAAMARLYACAYLSASVGHTMGCN